MNKYNIAVHGETGKITRKDTKKIKELLLQSSFITKSEYSQRYKEIMQKPTDEFKVRFNHEGLAERLGCSKQNVVKVLNRSAISWKYASKILAVLEEENLITCPKI